MNDMNGPDIQAVDDEKALMLELSMRRRITRRGCRQGAMQVSPVRPGAPRSAQAMSNVYSQRLGLEDVVVDDFIKDAFIPDGDAQVAFSQISTGVLLKVTWATSV